MRIHIHSQNLNLTEDQKKYIEQKMKKLATFAARIEDEASEIRVEIDKYGLHSNREEFKIEVTMYVPQAFIRGEDVAESIEAAADQVEEKLKKQIERYKAKQHHWDKKGKWIQKSTLEEVTEESQEAEKPDEFIPPKIIRRKRYENNQPMHEQEAIEQMELLGHTFYLFQNTDTNRFSLVYKRKDGYYGIIEPHKEEDFDYKT